MFRVREKYLFIAGMALIPPFLFQGSLLIRAFQSLMFILLSLSRGKRFRVLPNILLFAGVTSANLITPMGRVLFSTGFLPITAGALQLGLMRALLLIGLIYLSRWAISSSIRLPGEFGNLLGKMFFYFERITSFQRPRFTEKGVNNIAVKLVHSLDSFLYLLEADVDVSPGERETAPTQAAGAVLLGLLIALNWGLLFL